MATADLTAQELREAFDYNPDTGEFTRLPRKNTRRTDRFGVTSRGTLNRKLGYYIIGLGSCNYLAHRLAWLHVTGSWPKNTVDHINGDRTDNRFCNLRDVSRLVNAHNTHKPNKQSKSGLRGVSWIGHLGKWQAQIMAKGTHHVLGYFHDKHEAHAVYLKAKSELHSY